MPFSINKYCLAVFFSLSAIACNAQNFYVNTFSSTIGNSLYSVGIDSCRNPITLYSCPPTHNITSINERTYSDIAFDNHNMWYVSQLGSLYKRSLNDTSCQYVCTLPTAVTINSLAADSAGTIYAAGIASGSIGILCKYDSVGGADTVGKFPPGILSSGDLFFYGKRLFMTCVILPDSFYIAEIDIAHPKKSHFFMGLVHKNPWGAFSLADSIRTRTYIVFAPDTAHSELVEIDIPNKIESSTICTYNFQAYGAATYYDPPDTTTSIKSINGVASYFSLYNPSSGTIRINTNIRKEQINCLGLYDYSGRRVKNFSLQDFPGSLDISELPSGLYIFQMITIDGRKWNEKLLKATY